MKKLLKLPVTLISLAMIGCQGAGAGNTAKPTNSSATASPVFSPAKPQPDMPKNADYPGKGVVYKIDDSLGSVGINHENIEGLMPAMEMEFYVSDKALLTGLKIGDKIDFTIRYKDGTETVTAIKKIQ